MGREDSRLPDAAPVDSRMGDDSKRNPDLATGNEGGIAGAPGTGGNAGAAGNTGGAAAGGASDTQGASQTGGTTGLGGIAAGGTISPTGGTTLNPDASPGLPEDAPLAATCAMPKAPLNGAVQAPSLAVGGVAQYTCDTGYGRPTVETRQCQGDGTWAGAEPLCNLVDCGAPPKIAHSKVEAPATTYNATATYTCDPGYSSSAKTVLTCQSSGQWSTASFVCNPVNCGAAPSVANADVVAPTTTLDSVATYSCKTGFALTGTNKVRTCLPDGTWSLPAPACHTINCGAPPKIDNGSVNAPDTGFNGIAIYSCSDGFVLSGLTTRACQADETWSGTAPTCEVFTPKLTINKTGSGLGTVTSTTSTAINCGTTCAATFTYNSSVTITATAFTGQSFVGWEGPCKGKAACTLQLTKDTEVNAVFSPPPNIVFVTSTWHTPNLGGLAGADAICAARATAGGLAGTYRAWLSTSTVDAKDRLGTASGWVRPDGKPVLNQPKDIESSKIFYPPSLDEFGNTKNQSQTVITGTQSNGKRFDNTSYTTCGDWTSKVDEPSKFYLIGNAAGSSAELTSFGGFTCSQSAQLYCFGVDRTAFVAPDPMPGRRAFVTAGFWAPGGGIASADALCQQEASDAGLSGTFRALLAPTGASAASRFAGTDPWYRMDGLALAPSASAFFSSGSLDVAPNMTADGRYTGGFHWAGADSMNALGTDELNCKDWKSTLATDSSARGFDGIAYVNLFFGTYAPRVPCNGMANLVCLQTP